VADSDLLRHQVVLADAAADREDLHPRAELADRHRTADGVEHACRQRVEDERVDLAALEDVGGPERGLRADDAPRQDGLIVECTSDRDEGEHRQRRADDDACSAPVHGGSRARRVSVIVFTDRGRACQGPPDRLDAVSTLLRAERGSR
jgi:hypothetical protein